MRTVDQIADRIHAAFATKDLDLLGRVFDRLPAEGIDGTVIETIVGENGGAVLLHVEWPEPGEGREVDFFQAYLIKGGAVTEIQPHDHRRSAVAAISN